MGKTKTAFVANIDEKTEKSSEELYREKKARQDTKKHDENKVHIAGLKGGQRVKIVSAEVPGDTITLPAEESAKEEKKSQKEIAEKIRSKKYQGAKAKIEVGKSYPVKEAIKLVKETSYSKFDGTMEMHIVVKKVGVNTQVTLPHSAGKEKKIEVATEATIKNLTAGKINFDILLATADFMPKLVPFARILGPKGLMPNPKNGTIIKSAKESEKFGGNSLTLRTEKDAPLIHTVVGKASQADSELLENIEVILKALGKEKSVIRVFLKSTMSPSVKLQLA